MRNIFLDPHNKLSNIVKLRISTAIGRASSMPSSAMDFERVAKKMNNPITQIIADMQRAFNAKLYYPALLVALTLPEICIGMTMPRDVHIKKPHYIAFIREYANVDRLGIDGEGCYRLRGGVVHRGNAAGHGYWHTDNVIFTVPETGVIIHGGNIGARGKTALILNLEYFCRAMAEAAIHWYHKNIDNEEANRQMQQLLRWCPAGFPPYYAGSPVIGSGSS